MSQEVFKQFDLYVDRNQSPLRIDKFLSNKISYLSRSKIATLIENGFVEVNDCWTRANYKVKPNDNIIIYDTNEKSLKEIIPEKIIFEIVYEDSEIIVINKPAGIVVHPGVGNYTGTLLNGVLYYYQSKEQKKIENLARIGLVHRIDKDTSGLIVLAKTDFSLTHLSEQFSNHSIHRRYQALVWGDMKQEKGTINEYIARDKRKRQNFTVVKEIENAKHAVTHYEVLKRFRYVTLVECQLETGRTHQIRVHMSYLGHTIFQDKRYGGDKILKGTLHKRYKHFTEKVFKTIQRQALHAKELGFIHPKTGENMLFQSELPPDMMNCLAMWTNYVAEI